MSRELIRISVESVDDVTVSAQTQLTFEQFEMFVRGSLADTEIARLVANVRERVGAPMAVAFTRAGKKYVRRA